MKIKYNDKVVVEKLKVANTSLSRIIGLMFKTEMPDCDGLLIRPCNSIHTFFMRFSIDVVFLNKKMEVVKVIRNMKPWRISWIYFGASQVLEVKAGSLPSNIEKGDRLIEYV